jgi:hypothetical protein
MRASASLRPSRQISARQSRMPSSTPAGVEDLRCFLEALQNRVCRNAPTVVIATGADPITVLRGRENELRDANITVFYMAMTDVIGWGQNESVTSAHYQDFWEYFTKFKLNLVHLIGDRVMTMHDAVLTAAKAVRLAAPGAARPGSPTAVEVRDQLMNLHGLNAVPGASGTLSSATGSRERATPGENRCSCSSSLHPLRASSGRSARPISRHSHRRWP